MALYRRPCPSSSIQYPDPNQPLSRLFLWMNCGFRSRWISNIFYRQDLLFPGDACYLWPTDELSITPSSCLSCLSCLSFLSFLSNSSPRLISIICPCSVPRRACALAPFCRRYSSRRIAFLVLHLYIASARSPTNGTRPMRKSMAIFRAILNRSEDGRPPSISSQVPRTSNASNVSAPSPILEVL